MAEPLPEPDPALHWVGDEDPRRGRRQFELMVEWGLHPRCDLLEVGCGTGRLAYQLADFFEGGSYVGFDIAAAPIDWLQREYTSRRPSLRFDRLDVENDRYQPRGSEASDAVRFPYADGQFDYVCVHDVFVHMRPSAVDHYLHESRRVLRPGGRLLMTFMAILDADEPGEWSGRKYVRVEEGVYTRFPERVGQSMAYTWDLMVAMVRGAGFVVDVTIDGRWHSPFDKREGKVPGADLLVATAELDVPRPAERRRRTTWWRRVASSPS
jgi:SAM-dependent methyltransferase